MRKMATIRTIEEVKAIPDADKICAYRVGGWWVVDAVGKYTVGDLAIYVEIDAWVPNDVAPFLSKGQEPKEYEGIKGERLRSVRLRGQISQGLLLPLLPNLTACEGDDVSDALNIKIYSPPIPAQLAGEVKGPFPSYIPKTDQDRIQNLANELEEWKGKDIWEVTEKLDGSSMTVYIRDGEIDVCSRNLILKRNSDNSLWKAVYAQGIEEMLTSYYAFDNVNIALQGELVGEGIQSNPYKIKGQKFFLFDIYNIDEGRYFTPKERAEFVKSTGLAHVPIMDTGGLLQDDMNGFLLGAEGKSELNPQTEREGLVFKRHDGKASFKCISNRFLLKEK